MTLYQQLFSADIAIRNWWQELYLYRYQDTDIKTKQRICRNDYYNVTVVGGF